MHLRKQMVLRLQSGELTVSDAAREYGVSRNTVRMWLDRSAGRPLDQLVERSRRPARIPRLTPHDIEAEILGLKAKRPCWGAKKLAAKLWPEGPPVSIRTVDRILKRNGLVLPRGLQEPMQRFEREESNQLWQMDFKGLGQYGPAYSPLTVLDDASRFCLSLDPLPNHRAPTIFESLWKVFGTYGLPQEILMDNEPCFAEISGIGPSWLEVRLWLLGIRTTHSRPYHPQTQGKVERFHRTAELEIGRKIRQPSIDIARKIYADFIHDYNYERPHEALSMKVPGALYRPSPRRRPEVLPEHRTPPGATVYKLGERGFFTRKGKRYRLGRGLAGQTIYVQETEHGPAAYFAGNFVANLHDTNP